MNKSLAEIEKGPHNSKSIKALKQAVFSTRDDWSE